MRKRVQSRLVHGVVGFAVLAMAAGGSPSTGGTQLWSSRYDGPAHGGQDVALAVAVSPDGSRVFVTGGSDTLLHQSDYATIAYSSVNGHRLWTARLGLKGAAHDIAVSPDGSTVFVTGEAFPNTDADYGTVAYDAANGQQKWFASYDSGAGNDSATALAPSPDGSKLFITGDAALPESPGTSEYTTVAYEASSGEQLWTEAYAGVLGGGGTAKDLTVSPEGNRVYVTGGATGIGGIGTTNYATLAYDPETGGQLWLATYAGTVQDDVASSIAASVDRARVFVTGVSVDNDGGFDFATAAYDADTGTTLWVRRDEKGGLPATLTVGPLGGRVYVTGESDAGDYRTIAYNVNGTRAWSATYDGGSGDVATAVAVSVDGTRVYVTGSSYSFSSGNDYATVAYDNGHGVQLWVARFNGPGNLDDGAEGIAVSPDGHWVFVTGGSTGSRLDQDYLTVAYQTDR